MNIDFTQGIDYWVNLVKEFLKVISDFLADFNIKLFADSAAEASSDESEE